MRNLLALSLSIGFAFSSAIGASAQGQAPNMYPYNNTFMAGPNAPPYVQAPASRTTPAYVQVPVSGLAPSYIQAPVSRINPVSMQAPVTRVTPPSLRPQASRANSKTTSKVVAAPSKKLTDPLAATGKKPLQGSVNYLDMNEKFGESLQELTEVALEKLPKYREAARLVDHYSTRTQKSIRFAKDAINYAVPYRGFSMSIEGSRMLLDKNQKINNLCIAELAKQRYWDEMHPKITAKVMQIAMGLGMSDPEESQRAVSQGVAGLKDLVGEQNANHALDLIIAWKDQLKIPQSIYDQKPWDVDTADKVYQNALKKSADGDPMISFICKNVKKFDHGKVFNFTASVVESQLAATSFLAGTPLIGAGAELLNTAFVMSTGGPEENKILKELYFGRRMEIRRKRISDEVQLALANYEKALLTHNGTLLASSEAVLAQLVGPDALPKVLGRELSEDIEFVPPIELAKKEAK